MAAINSGHLCMTRHATSACRQRRALRHHNRQLVAGLAALISLALAWPLAASADRSERKRATLDLNERHTLERLFEENASAREMYDRAYGHAVFNAVKISLLFTGGGGQGVAVDKATGKRTYMNMGTGGLNLGLGGKAYSIVFLFQTAQTFSDFVNNGWQGGVSADATAGRAGLDVGTSFRNGVAFFQLTDAGLMLQADLTGTRYWRNDKLN
jgi:lipid-binding SYLF domain-containing protein